MQPVEPIVSRIIVARGQRVMIDADLAALYGVTTKRLNEQVKRNRNRFPAEFVFQLSVNEKAEVVANCDHLIRAFVQLRNTLAAHREIGKRLDELERKVGSHDRSIAQILAAIRQLTIPTVALRRRRIGFV